MIASQSAHARIMGRLTKLKAILIVATTGALLWPGAAMAAGYPREIAPGLTVNFPAQPVQAEEEKGNSVFASVEPSSDNSPAVLVAYSLTRFGWPRWLVRHYPDLVISDCGQAGVENQLQKLTASGAVSGKIQLEPVQRNSATGGFPGFYFAADGIDLTRLKGKEIKYDKKTILFATRRGQLHGYLLFVNGNMIGIGILQPEGAHFDRQVLDDLVAAAHFPPIDDVGTPDEQENNFLLIVGALMIGALVVVIAIIALLVVGIASLVRHRRRKKRRQMAA